jgi:flotillin
MISSGKGDVGAAKLTGEVLEVMERLPSVVEGMTGVNISKVNGYDGE